MGLVAVASFSAFVRGICRWSHPHNGLLLSVTEVNILLCFAQAVAFWIGQYARKTSGFTADQSG